jgi:predicted RNase H-like HicB family nuclease
MSIANISFFPSASTMQSMTFQPAILTCSFILQYKEALTVYIEQLEDGSFVARNPSIMTHGVGDTCEDALSDYQEMLIDYFKSLVESENILASHLCRQLEFLRTILPDEIID